MALSPSVLPFFWSVDWFVGFASHQQRQMLLIFPLLVLLVNWYSFSEFEVVAGIGIEGLMIFFSDF
jgi:hypothetical protein